MQIISKYIDDEAADLMEPDFMVKAVFQNMMHGKQYRWERADNNNSDWAVVAYFPNCSVSLNDQHQFSALLSCNHTHTNWCLPYSL